MNELRTGLTDGQIVSKDYLEIKDAEIDRLRGQLNIAEGCYQDEVDRLRAEFEEYRKVKAGQIDYLRAENERLRSMIAADPLASDQEQQKSG